ncbi:deoxyguanosinetriphosphate triphosphohydrolase [Mariprofundus sp. EBB-1]|uniref:deoxyguanosinetriphosphate triphosphohydrolase n=1 Tax=Mariprofundus sp. EBB-1 TaxID=2650971 RepID=UPI000EF1DCAE|nr:deoxyguanosinetriphosphate triphosphohydrolase [Mariprofundus sp. EBB-1]RLL51960.1 deoxyguanosinetriphosphate triphosphohydrolase [Mariprofundus sp. EBB-1]
MTEQAYETTLASYACKTCHSRGRVHDEPESPYRNPYQRDRDRIIHSTAFRRLEYKTQVFVNHEGDHYRTRLTHSIEVAQIARSICRSMRLHEDLAEAVALAHDLGHTPFGHSGQDALNSVMKPYGGFEHNRQSLRIVESLEHKYAAFTGLNLSYETREGIVKHHSTYDTPQNSDLSHFNLHEQPALEAQIGNLADEIAYNNHDIDDGYRAGMLSIDDLMGLELFGRFYEQAEREFPDVIERLKVNETVRMMINFLIGDVVEETSQRIKAEGIKSFADVRAAGSTLVGFSKPVRRINGEMKKFLYKNMYRHYRVARMANKAERVLCEIFDVYIQNPSMLPENQQHEMLEAKASDGLSKQRQARIIADYIAGMTDRYALEEHERLFNVHVRP